MSYDLNDLEDCKCVWSDYFWKDYGILCQCFYNFYEVGGGMWCGNQLFLECFVFFKEQGFKIIFNICGIQLGVCYYDFEKEVCEEYGFEMIDMLFGFCEVFYFDCMQCVKKIFELIEYLVFLYCKLGVDCVGLMLVLFRLIYLKMFYDEVIIYFFFKYLYVKVGKMGVFDYFFEIYWFYNELNLIGFWDWVENVYD